MCRSRATGRGFALHCQKDACGITNSPQDWSITTQGTIKTVDYYCSSTCCTGTLLCLFQSSRLQQGFRRQGFLALVTVNLLHWVSPSERLIAISDQDIHLCRHTTVVIRYRHNALWRSKVRPTTKTICQNMFLTRNVQQLHARLKLAQSCLPPCLSM